MTEYRVADHPTDPRRAQVWADGELLGTYSRSGAIAKYQQLTRPHAAASVPPPEPGEWAASEEDACGDTAENEKPTCARVKNHENKWHSDGRGRSWARLVGNGTN